MTADANGGTVRAIKDLASALIRANVEPTDGDPGRCNFCYGYNEDTDQTMHTLGCPWVDLVRLVAPDRLITPDRLILLSHFGREPSWGADDSLESSESVAALDGRRVWEALGRKPEDFDSYVTEHGWDQVVEEDLLPTIREYASEVVQRRANTDDRFRSPAPDWRP